MVPIRIVFCLLLSLVVSLNVPADVYAAGHGQHSGGVSQSGGTYRGQRSVEINRQPKRITEPRHTGPASAFALYQAAHSALPPQLHQNPTAYVQKLQAWEQNHSK